jgi:hypothetical protein
LSCFASNLLKALATNRLCCYRLPPPTHTHTTLLPGGARQDRALLFSRFRLNHVTRDDGSPLYSVTFLGGYGSLVMGSGAGELRQVDAYTQQEVEVVDAHSAPVTLLQVGKGAGKAL